MPHRNRPRHGSLQYKRKRARRIYPRINWVSAGEKSKEFKPLGFAGWKAGMTHVQYVDSNAKSPTYGKIITKPVTIIDAPSLFICGIRFYRKSAKGMIAAGEKWADKLPKELKRKTMPAKKAYEPTGAENEVRLIVSSQPAMGGMKKKKPDVFEIGIGGSDIGKKTEYAGSLLGKEIYAKDIFHAGELIDVSAVTKGHGFTGPVKRYGIRIQTRKDQQHHRHVGSIGSTTPRHVDWRVPAAGQYGFFNRTEFSKRLLMVDDDAAKITPKGGFVGYGIPKSFMMIEGSVPGSRKRLIILKKASRKPKTLPVEIKYISLESKQGA